MSGIYVPPVIEHSDWDRTGDRVELFTITRPNPDYDGHETHDGSGDAIEPEISTTYTMPAKPHPGLGLGFLKRARQMGVDLAMSWLLEEAIGSEGYDALSAEPELDDATLAAIMLKVRATVLGKLEAKKG